MRIGHGYDVHKLVDGRKCIIGGVDIPCNLGLLGHSDADVLLHAISDAILGAAAMGDIGHLFPDKDDKWKDADILNIFEEGMLFFKPLAGAAEVILQKTTEGIAQDAVSVVTKAVSVYMPFADLVDIKAEIERLEKEAVRLASEMKRAEGMLQNEKFLSKAPEEKIQEEKQKLESFSKMSEQVIERLHKLQQ